MTSRVAVLRIPTNEELVIALDTSEIVKSLNETAGLTASF